MVNNFVTFAPVGMVLVAMLGIGVAEYSGFINAAIRAIMSVTSEAYADADGHTRRYR